MYVCVYIYSIYINIYKNLATVSPILSHFQVHNKLEAKVGACGWRKTFRKRHIDRSKKDVSSGAKEFKQHGWLPLGEWGSPTGESPLCCFLQLRAHPQWSQ